MDYLFPNHKDLLPPVRLLILASLQSRSRPFLSTRERADEQYPVESRFAVATAPPMNKTPVSTVALQHKSVFSVLRYATPLPINRTPFQP